MPSQVIQWFPGHMAKTRRLMQENLSKVDVLIEVLDARIPRSSRNPEIHRIAGQKPMLTLLNKAGLASQAATDLWVAHFKSNGDYVLPIDCVSGDGIKKIPDAIREVLAEKVERYREKGMEGRRLRAMIVGIPNVGKSSLINRLCGSGKTKVENRPGVTMTKQWVGTDIGLDLMDMPGVLWPKFDDAKVGENLAFTGAIKDQILDTEELAMLLCARLNRLCPALLAARYKLNEEDLRDLDGYDLLALIGKKRGMLVSGGETDFARTANMLLDEFRHAVIGRITLEKPTKD
ncbi:MAG: ribosome biogenesis GTPase YlqF [Clostridia bacterium]|nr:ribosome biogenesis GTPase YlqF [Clostridia bacterium]